MLKDHQKPHIGTRYKGNLISLFSSVHYYNNDFDTYKKAILI